MTKEASSGNDVDPNAAHRAAVLDAVRPGDMVTSELNAEGATAKRRVNVVKDGKIIVEGKKQSLSAPGVWIDTLFQINPGSVQAVHHANGEEERFETRLQRLRREQREGK